MTVSITSKDDMQAIASKLKNISTHFSQESTDVSRNLSRTEDFDGISVQHSASIIQNNLKNVARDMEYLATNINNYISEIKNLDTYDLDIRD